MPDDWTSLPLNFDSSASPITVTINIQNLATDRAILVSLADNTNITGVNVAREYNSSSFSGNTTNKTIAGGNTGTFTFTLAVSNKNSDITGVFDLDINLANSSTTGHNVNANIIITETLDDTEGYIIVNDSQRYRIYQEETLNLTNVNTIQFAISGNYSHSRSALRIAYTPEIYSSFLLATHEDSCEYVDENHVYYYSAIYEIDEDVAISIEVDVVGIPGGSN